jgi:GxxExxY protein
MESIIKNVYDALGPGYSESVYQNAMEVAMRHNGIPYDRPYIQVKYMGHIVGQMYTDMVAQDTVLEFKAVKKLTDEHRQQIKIYMKELKICKGYLINFGENTVVLETFTLQF